MKREWYILTCCLLCFFASGQGGYAQNTPPPTTDIKGQVFDEYGDPLPAATVRVIGTKYGTHSDGQGLFTLKGYKDWKGLAIEVSFVGLVTQRVKLTGPKVVVHMKANSFELQDVVVTGYQTIGSRAFTGATSMVKIEDVKIEGITDVSRMLEGRVAGLTVQNVSGTFGTAPRINIRGGASILGNVQPLWVVDGVVYEDLVALTPEQLTSGDAITLVGSAIAGLNASDIEDIQVLKDASATSIYGARALNGVIVVRTKSGIRNGKNKISYTMELSTRTIPSYRNFDLLNSQETMSIYREMEQKGYLSLNQSLYGRRGGIFHQMYHNLTTFDGETGKYLLENTPEARRAFLQRGEYANTNWFEHLFVNRPTINHTVSLSGGGKDNAMYASLGYFHDGGWTITDNVQRFTANLKSTFYLTPKLRVTLSGIGTYRRQKAPGTIPQKKNMVLGAFERDFDINPFSYALSTSRTLRPVNERGEREYYRNNWAPFNILTESESNKMDISLLDYKTQGEVSYRPIEPLELKALVSFRQAHTSTSHYVREESNVVQAFRGAETPDVAKQNIYLYRDPSAPHRQPEVPLARGGMFNKTETILRSMIARFSAEYTWKRDGHDLRAFAFSELRSTDRQINPYQGFGIQYDKGGQVYTDPLIFRKLAYENAPYFALTNYYDRGITFSTSATYMYDGKYILNAVFNMEGSNNAGRGRQTRWLPTWNIGAKWNMDEEGFMESFDKISQLSLRTSFGLTAKTNEQATNSRTVFTNIITQHPNIKNRENALKIVNIENRDLTWEKMYELNFGIDFGWFNNRINASVDLYQRNSFDLIDLIRTSGIGGEYYRYANFGDLCTRGIEFALRTENVVTHDFNWSSSFTFSYMHQRITRMLNIPNAFDMVSGRGRGNVEGFPRGALFSYNFQGLTPDGLPFFDFGLYPSNEDPRSKIIGADFTDSQYTKSYLVYNGPTEPVVISGLSNTFKYKGIELSLFITSQIGQKTRLNPSFDPTFGDLNVFSNEYYNRWLNPGDELATRVPTIPSQEHHNLYGAEGIERAYNTYNYSQERVVDASFVRMKNIVLGYTLPSNMVQKWGMSSATIRFNASNPFLIYASKALHGQDPEYYNSGGVALPVPQQYTLTLSLGF